MQRYMLVASLVLGSAAPQDASVSPFRAHCGSFAVQLALPGVSPAQHIICLTQVCGSKCFFGGIECPQCELSHNPLLEADDLLLLLFPALKVDLDQSLQFHQVLLHPFPVDVLQTKDRPALSLDVACAQYLHVLVKFTHIKIHYLTIRNLRGDEVGHDEGPVGRGGDNFTFQECSTQDIHESVYRLINHCHSECDTLRSLGLLHIHIHVNFLLPINDVGIS